MHSDRLGALPDAGEVALPAGKRFHLDFKSSAFKLYLSVVVSHVAFTSVQFSFEGFRRRPGTGLDLAERRRRDEATAESICSVCVQIDRTD